MNRKQSFIVSLYNAFCGIKKSFLTERNLRVHFAFGNLIMIFAYFYGLSRVEWAVLLLTVALVFCAELINTAIEDAVDTATDEICESAKSSKDAAAGGVLFSAIVSVIVGFLLFFDVRKITDTLSLIFMTPAILIPCLIVGIIDIILIIFVKEKK